MSSMYAHYRSVLRDIAKERRPGMVPVIGTRGNGGWCDWTVPHAFFDAGDLTRTKYGYMPTFAVEEMRESHPFDRGGWWTVLAWAATDLAWGGHAD